jgi:xylulose-5-phosphate/fructose-6-phosphate phosphoketolase
MAPVIDTEEKVNGSLSAYGKARSTVQGSPLSSDELRKTHAYWRACNYLALGMIYLQDNPFLKAPLKFEPRLGVHLNPPQPPDQENSTST